MAAITTAVNRQAKGAPKIRRFLMKNSTTIPKGAIVAIEIASGLVINAVAGALNVVVGIAAETMVSGTGGADWLSVEYDREYLFAASSIAQTALGTAMLVIDNNTIDETSAGSATVGKLTEYISATLGWVMVPGLSI